MPRTSSTILFLFVIALSLALVGWWTTFHLRQARELELAGQALAAGDGDAAARALGAADAAALTELARSRRRMWVSEGLVFGAMLLLGGILFWTNMRREAALRADQDRFLAGATHELKTPLATIQLLLESLRNGRVPADKRDRYLRSGLLEAERLENGLTNVLTAAGLRTAGGAQKRRVEPGDLADDLQEALAAMGSRAEAAGVELRAEVLERCPTVRDPEAMQLVLRNLLDNAVKYSRAGGAVTVELRREGGEAVLTVADRGKGMDSEELQHAFQPFWRGRDSATGGAGLGLHLVRELVAAHGGSVAAASDGPDRGSRFTVRLPRREASA